MRVFKILKNFFKSKALGFYFTAAVVALSLVQLIVYVAAFTPVSWESYMHWTVIFFSVLAILSGIGLALFKITSPWAPAAATLMEFLSFLMFMRYGYMYFSQVFYSGISLSLIFQMYYGYLVSIILYIVIFGLGVAAMSIKQNKPEENTKVETQAITSGGEA